MIIIISVVVVVVVVRGREVKARLVREVQRRSCACGRAAAAVQCAAHIVSRAG